MKFVSFLKFKFVRFYFGFVNGHFYLSKRDFNNLKQYIGLESKEIINEYENKFSNLIGEGYSVSFASARMGFYSLMKILNIGKGDEIILLGSTCSVMVNAILRLEAVPIYADMDPNTLGSDVNSIKSKITNSTKLILAQHSFGIPCDILPIQKIAQEKNIFLLEDCALSLGSKYMQKAIGTFGNAALFSTDHSKPINTMIGGIVYTDDPKIACQLKEMQRVSGNLSTQKQESLFYRLKFESFFCNPRYFSFFNFFDKIYVIKRKLLKEIDPFLSDDSESTSKNNSYPYPAKLPVFLALVGIMEISRWNKSITDRKLLLNNLITILEKTKYRNLLPSAYFDKKYDIVPLRLVWSDTNAIKFKKLIQKNIDVSWFWFRKPIIGSKDSLDKFNYVHGMCPISEKTGENIINIPCNINDIYFTHLQILIKDSFNK